MSASSTGVSRPRRRPWKRLAAYLAVLGPGIIVANAGNDAGGVFTYSNIGAKYGLSMMWLLIPITVALIVTQEMVARLGCMTGKGLMDLIREKFGVRWTLFAAGVVLLANGGTTLAEFAGIAGALGLLGVGRPEAVIGAAILLSLVVLRGNRTFVERVFLVLGLVFVSYIVTVVILHPNWGTIGSSLVTPSFSHPNVSTGNYLGDIIALIGTSITPYMQLFLQSSVADKGSGEEELGLVRFDVISGSIFADVVAGFMIVATAVTLSHPSAAFPKGLLGVGVQSAAAAAQALAPVAGVHAYQLFAVGLLGASLLAAAVLPLSTAFAVCEAFGAERSVQSSPSDAPLFFTLFLGIMAVGAALILIPGVPIAGIAIGTQTLDGVLLPILLVFVIILASDERLLGKRRNRGAYAGVAIAFAGMMTLLAVALLVTSL